jgi:hypothetical protein
LTTKKQEKSKEVYYLYHVKVIAANPGSMFRNPGRAQVYSNYPRLCIMLWELMQGNSIFFSFVTHKN